jgi:ATP-binding cassette, subfamily B, bacterial
MPLRTRTSVGAERSRKKDPTPRKSAKRDADLVACKRLVQYARGYAWHLAGIVLLSLLGPACALLYPLPLKIAVDNFLGSSPVPQFVAALLPSTAITSSPAILTLAAGLLVGVAALNQLQRAAVALLSRYTGARLVLNFRGEIFRHVQRLSLSYHEAKGAADSTYRILNDASCIQDILVDGAVGLVSAAVTFAGLLYVTARLDLQLAFVALSISPFLLLFSIIYRRLLRHEWRQLKAVESSVMSIAYEVLAALRVVKAFAREEHEHERFSGRSMDGVQAQLRVASLQRQLSFCVVLTTALGEALVLVIGMQHIRLGLLSLGELLVVMAYLRRLYDPIRNSTQKVASLQSSLASAERIFALVDEEPGVVERPGARPISRASGRIAFRDVSFGYAKDRPVLQAASFDIAPGSRVLIRGASGTGKTTLISLLTRFYDPTSGRILLDGVDLRDYRITDLRNQFAILPQEPVLFSTSIADNIAYADPDATREQIVKAAEAADAHDFIARLPDGYDTQVGDRGMSLSGGERQRVALARAFLKDAPILILDEPTSSVDLQSEIAILAAMERLMKGRTTFVIAHRLHGVKELDLLIEVEDGRIAVRNSGSLVASTLSG